MAINVSFAGANIRKPGAYSQTKVSLAGGFPLAATGTIALVGEAEGGEPGSSAGVQTFTSEDMASLISIYKSGPIVDAARLLIAPARDGRVPNGASLIRVYKTNASTQASEDFDNAAATALFTITSRNFGEDENLISVKIEAGVSSASARIITVQKGSVSEVLSENAYAAWMVLQYTGAQPTATITISPTTLAVATGLPADNLSITLAGKTVQDVVDIINNHASYTASTTLKFANARSAAELDPITTATDVKTAPVTLRAQQQELLDIINGESSFVEATRAAGVEGTVAVVARTFLSGGALGASTNASFQAGFDALLAVRCNTVVPLISRDASALLALGLTDPSSTFTVDAVNLQAVTHCITASNTKNRSERNCYVSKKASFSQVQSDAQDLASERASMLFQDVEILDTDGNLKFEDPWAAACILAGIQGGTDVGTPATFKFINVNGLDHQDYNEKTQVELAIDAGLLPLESVDSGGFRVVVHNTTYGVDANFVYNRVHVLEAADYVAYNLRQQLEAIYVGIKGRSGTATDIKNSVAAIMSQFLKADIIVGDDTNGGLGWKDLTVVLNGNTAYVDITITPVQGIDFILNRITLANVQQSA